MVQARFTPPQNPLKRGARITCIDKIVNRSSLVICGVPKRLALTVGLALSLLLPACGIPGPELDAGFGQADQTPPGHIVLAVAGEPRTLIPLVGSDSVGPADHLF